MDVEQTFTAGRLLNDAVLTQFNENLPWLSDTLLKAEFEARAWLSRTLHSCTLMKMVSLQHPDIETMKVVTKSMVSSLRHDLHSFVQARRDCAVIS